jgi:hypothetical protein
MPPFMSGHPGKGRCIAVAISFCLCNPPYMVIPRNDAMEPKNRTALKIAIYEKYLKMSNIASFEETYFARTSKEGIYPQLHYNLNGPQCDRARDSRYQIKRNAAVFKD